MWGGMAQNITNAQYRTKQLQMKLEKRATTGWGASAGSSPGRSARSTSRTTASRRSWDTTQPLYFEPSNQDKTHSITFNGVYDLPFGKNRQYMSGAKGVTQHLLGNWRADWILNYVSGYPIGIPNLLNYCGTWQVASENENSLVQQLPRVLPDQPPARAARCRTGSPTIREPQYPAVNAAHDQGLQHHGEESG